MIRPRSTWRWERPTTGRSWRSTRRRRPSAWEGDVWSFSTLEYFPIDDFESYTNESPNRVFQTWIDGWGFSEDEFFPTGNPGNATGSMIGYNPEVGNIMETAIIHGGKQSMPVEYNNVNSPYYSEIERTWETPQNWTLNGADTLQVWFRGQSGRVHPEPIRQYHHGCRRVGHLRHRRSVHLRLQDSQRRRLDHRPGGQHREYRSVGQGRRDDSPEPVAGLAVCRRVRNAWKRRAIPGEIDGTPPRRRATRAWRRQSRSRCRLPCG